MSEFQDLVPVILAGGSGTRLWPLSRSAFPKHLVELTGSASLLQITTKRLLRVSRPEAIITITAAGQAILARRQLASLNPLLTQHLLLEPSPRNTAAAVAIAAHYARRHVHADAVIFVCPSDHLILDESALIDALRPGVGAARDGQLVTFGITPSRPETGFGYIAEGEALNGYNGVMAVNRFVEKPPLVQAESMLRAGGHFWNSGMFLMSAEAVLRELAQWAPAIASSVERSFSAFEDGGEFLPELYNQIPSVPIDKAVMEKSRHVAVVPCDPKWSDVGSWQALWELTPKDNHGNAIAGDVLIEAAKGNLVKAQHRLVTLAGVSDLAVIETPDAVMIADRRQSEMVKNLVGQLLQADRKEAHVHAREMRPWGSYTILYQGSGFAVREVILEPGGRLTLQHHEHRDEHWIIIEGVALVEINGNAQKILTGGSVHVPKGQKHQLKNDTDSLLRIIEIQLGERLEDNDTVRHGAEK
ncbi:MAG: mannose-1-phosphate guanylyltransferase/mannose-6-phosphate isomerase [Cyanobacteria bacterium J06638_22]